MEKLKEILENEGWKIDEEIKWADGTMGWQISKYSPAGEDFSITIETNNNIDKAIEEINEQAEKFDEDEHSTMWIEAKYHRTLKNIPSNKELVQDAENIHNMLKELAGKVNKLKGDN